MSEPFRRLESDAESAFRRVDFGHDPLPGADCVARLHRAVDQESRRLTRPGAALRISVGPLATAAAILIAIGATWFASPPVSQAPADPSEHLAAWDEAIGRSSAAMTRLIDASALPEAESVAEAELGIDDFSDAFDSNLGAGA